MKDRRKRWECVCGHRMLLTDEQILSGKETCPQCGVVVEKNAGVDMNQSADDTQLINIAEMARMAQEGVDVGISGEWDTAMSRDPEHRRDHD